MTFAHYSAPKTAMIEMAKALSLEGREFGINANAVAPFSTSRMTGRSNEEQSTSPFGPRYLAQLAVWLSRENKTESGSVFEVGGGIVHRVRTELSRALNLPEDLHTAENIAAGEDVLNDFSTAIHPGIGDSWTIGRELLGDDWAERF